MTWNYRLMRRATPDETTVAIHEVYYDAAGAVTNWTVNPCHPMGGGFDGDPVVSLAETLGMMLRAFAMPVLDYPVNAEPDEHGMREVDYDDMGTAMHMARLVQTFKDAAAHGEPATWEYAMALARMSSPDRVIGVAKPEGAA